MFYSLTLFSSSLSPPFHLRRLIGAGRYLSAWRFKVSITSGHRSAVEVEVAEVANLLEFRLDGVVVYEGFHFRVTMFAVTMSNTGARAKIVWRHDDEN